MIIGSHVSFKSDQLLGSVKEALSYGANTFMFYTGAPQNTMRSPISMDYTKEALKLMEANNIDISIKQLGIDNNTFYTELEQYDILLKNSKNIDEINNIFTSVLATYEEEVLSK